MILYQLQSGYGQHAAGQSQQMYVNQQQQQSILQGRAMNAASQQLPNLSNPQTGPIANTKSKMNNIARSSNFDIGNSSIVSNCVPLQIGNN